MDHNASKPVPEVQPLSSVRIIAADQRPETRAFYQAVLPALGHSLLCTAQTGQELIDQCRKHGPDLVISDGCLADMDVANAAEQVWQERRIPFIVATNDFDPQLIKGNGADHIWAYLIKPVQRGRLAATIPFVLSRFKKLQALWQELEFLAIQANAGPCLQTSIPSI
jgi:response regulator NasT